jgi:hypothetical protein
VAQCAPPVACPREAVQQGLLRLELNGIFLRRDTSSVAFDEEAWAKAARFFLHYDDKSTAAPRLHVVGPYCSVDDLSIEGKKAEIYFGFFDLGEIDSSLRWKPSDPKIMKFASTFHLALSERRWETKRDGTTIMHTVSPPQWLITDGPPVVQWLSFQTAVRYLKLLRQRINDQASQKNADATLVALKKLSRWNDVPATCSSPWN